MKKEDFTQALISAKDLAKKCKFSQTFEIIVALKGVDIKKTDHQIDNFVTLPHGKGKPIKIAALVGPELKDSAGRTCDFVVLLTDFVAYDGKKKEIKSLANAYDFFIAQANIMPQVAKTFGRFFGPRGKMPNPKAGCVVPPNANLELLTQKLSKTTRIQAKVQPVIQTAIGTEAQTIEEVSENALAVYTNVLHSVPGEENNIKFVAVKLTMGPLVRLGQGLSGPLVGSKKSKKSFSSKQKNSGVKNSSKEDVPSSDALSEVVVSKKSSKKSESKPSEVE